MASVTDSQQTTAPERARLNGWKEIASHFGRGVRTVQRWERELQLPVRRIDTGRGQVTYAFVDELDRWRESAAAKKAASEPGANGEAEGNAHASGGGTDSRSAAQVLQSTRGPKGPDPPVIARLVGRKSTRAGATVVAGVVLIALCALAWNRFAGAAHPPRPASAEVVNNALRVFDAEGSVLWEHPFDFPLTEAAYANRVPGYDRPPIVITDVDGDGIAEVLFVAEPWLPASQGLFCFNADGSLRFRHVPSPTVTFGRNTYAPTWRGVTVYVSSQADRPRDIWFVSTHLSEYPTLLEKLDAAGNVSSEYWSNGQIAFVQAEQVEGRPLVFVGAINNESKGASLAVLDAQHPSGSAPAVSEDYRCADCPGGAPLAFLVFPRLDVTAALGTHAHVSSVLVDRLGQVLVDVFHDVGDGVPPELRGNATTQYRLNSQFRVIGADLGERFPSVHVLFERKGLLDHPFGRDRDAGSLWPVRRWDRSGFVEITRPESPAGK
jgi:hypothetical protein